jgi:hypothetical protein
MDHSLLHEFWDNFRHNLFKPLLLFFYMGFAVPILGVAFEFPYVLYQGLTIYLLVSIGWKGGEELASLSADELSQAGGFMVVGFLLNFVLGIMAYAFLRGFTRLRKVDAATVAAYYGSDSAGTFVTCVGVLGGIQALVLAGALHNAKIEPLDLRLGKDVTSENISKLLKDPKLVEETGARGVNIPRLSAARDAADQYKPAAYMPVMLAIMEIPGCLVGLFLVSRLRQNGMDRLGNMPDEPGYDPHAKPDPAMLVSSAHGGGHHESKNPEMAVERDADLGAGGKPPGIFTWALFHEVFLNPGLFLLFGGIVIGFISRLQGEKVTADDDPVFVDLFKGLLCLFLLEMGMTASRRLRDLRTAGWRFVVFALVTPNIFATIGMCVAHLYSLAIGEPFALGTYVLFAVLCGAASYIAVPAVQRLAIPEASPTLPLAASLGVTFSYNVTIGIPMYILIAKLLTSWFPHGERLIS